MSRADDIRDAAERAAMVAELEEQLSAAKDDDAASADLKHELRYARWVQRGGPDADPDGDNRADAAHRERYEQEA